MTIKTGDKQQLIDALKKYHDTKFTPGVYEHSIFGQAAIMLENEIIYCEHCKFFCECRAVAVCKHPHGLKNPGPECSCCFAKPRTTDSENKENS